MVNEKEVRISYKLGLLLKKSSKKRSVENRHSYEIHRSNIDRIYSYSRTLRHFDEIKTKVGQQAMNHKVLGFFSKHNKSNPSPYEHRVRLIKPYTQDICPPPLINENT